MYIREVNYYSLVYVVNIVVIVSSIILVVKGRKTNYVNSILQDNELIKFETKLHWIIFIPYILLGMVTQGLGFILIISPAIRYLTSEFCVTSKRVLIKIGLISRKTIEMNLNKVEGISYDQGILGRIFGYGKIYIRGTGGSSQVFRNVIEPILFQKAVNDAIADYEQSNKSDMKQCPDCAEYIKIEALKCRYCSRSFE